MFSNFSDGVSLNDMSQFQCTCH